MSELVKRSIKALSSIVNIATGITHPLDEARAKELFKALRADGEQLTYDAIEELALANKWPERHAKFLAELAERIGNGGRVAIKHPRDWGEPTVARLKAEIASGKA
ncbi:hypothetical protein HOP51_07195 [Halomonas sp. MCCC 1A11036]|uniref:Uncharacterized protein n=1 Tax=Billgrantia zhangzhouensis TaxID=2733481 RepID=A0ABS9ADU8_9GAMM|nr:DUF1889 family protein [Halomonas zhangzhouensis]MCE8019900.1 hypothetical protein [Halomonas zhangzhouensis]